MFKIVKLLAIPTAVALGDRLSNRREAKRSFELIDLSPSPR